MSSNQWEVVTKTRKQKNMDRKVEAHIEKKRLAAVPIKLEEILPTQQYRSIISGKGNKSPPKSNGIAKSVKPKSPKKPLKAATSKSEADSSSKKPSQPKLPPKPKSPEAALRQITPDDFSAHLEQLKLTFPGSELLWLRGVASYLNTNLPFDCDPTFAGKSVDYPSSLLTSKWRAVLVKFLDEMGAVNLTYFYDTLLTSMAMELAKNCTVFGYKLLLQLIAKTCPEIVSSNLAKIAILRNSYQNRSNVCLSILWAVGQCGYELLTEGIRVWQNIMLPNLEMKSYTKFVIEYLENVLKCLQNRGLNLNQNEFFSMYNTLRTIWPGVSKEYQQRLKGASELLLHRYIMSTEKHSHLFLTFLRDISLNDHLEADACIKCLSRNEDSFQMWKMNFNKQLVPTILLIRRIEEGCDEYSVKVRNSKAYKQFLYDTQVLNMELDVVRLRDAKRKYNLDEIYSTHKRIQEKVAQQKKKHAAEQKKSCCFWTIGSLVLVVAIGVILAYDTEVIGKGVFAQSSFGKALHKVGVLPYVEKAWYTTMSANARAYKWAEKHVPPYAIPVMQLTSDVFKLARNTLCSTWGKVQEYLSAKLPVAAEFLEQYVPGLPKKIEFASAEAQKLFFEMVAKSTTFFKTQIFVGRFSPENLSKALNTTTNMASEYYSLFERKVDFYAKLK